MIEVTMSLGMLRAMLESGHEEVQEAAVALIPCANCGCLKREHFTRFVRFDSPRFCHTRGPQTYRPVDLVAPPHEGEEP